MVETREEALAVPPRAAFIVGVGRSGTTLLVSLLDGHPELLSLPHESKAVSWHAADDPVSRLYEVTPYGDRFPAEPDAREAFDARLRSRLQGPANLRTALLALVDAVVRTGTPSDVAKASTWLEKTPKHLPRVPTLLAEFGPSTRAICVIRDPRAVFLSRSRRWNRRGVHALRVFARRWAFYDALSCRFELSHPGFRVVRYEDLVRHPEPTLRGVADHLGIAWHASLLEPSRMGEPWRGNSSFEQRGAQAGLSSASLDRYRTELADDEISEIERLLGPRMVHRGYALEVVTDLGPTWRRLRLEIASRGRVLREGWRWRREASGTPADA
jgi:hypothetical protein